jgi:hypothetical protein
MVELMLVADQMNLAVVAFEPQTLARRAEPQLELRADRYEFDEATELFDQKGVAFVTPVEADFLPEQTGRDAHPQRRPRGRLTCG